jgi:hypothetical protein
VPTEQEWEAIPKETILVADLVFPLHDIDPQFIWPAQGVRLENGPIRVERLNTGQFFIHNGRHRAIRAMLAGDLTIEAKVKL